jgi:integrase/recombinase XerD
MDATKILSRDEIVQVIKRLRSKSKRSKLRLGQLAIFRLACCCGLRSKEIRGIDMGDVIVTGDRPAIRIRKGVTKGRAGQRKARIVPLWWDRGTLEDLRRWYDSRIKQGATPGSPFITLLRSESRVCRANLARRWQSAIGILGKERVRQLSIHCGRHSFCSHALNAGRSPVEVRDAAGHASINTTSIYLHLIERDSVPDIFPTK